MITTNEPAKGPFWPGWRALLKFLATFAAFLLIGYFVYEPVREAVERSDLQPEWLRVLTPAAIFVLAWYPVGALIEYLLKVRHSEREAPVASRRRDSTEVSSV
jgi:hypothetical protein